MLQSGTVVSRTAGKSKAEFTLLLSRPRRCLELRSRSLAAVTCCLQSSPVGMRGPQGARVVALDVASIEQPRISLMTFVKPVADLTMAGEPLTGQTSLVLHQSWMKSGVEPTVEMI